MAKSVFPKELLNNQIEKNNQDWINEYKESTGFGKGYLQSLERFFKYKKNVNKPFNLYELHDVTEYIQIHIDNNFSENTINAVISAISGFRKYLIDHHPDIFGEKFLDGLLDLKEYNGEKKNIPYQPLNLVQLNHTKEFIKQNVRARYIFEIIYQMKISKKDIEICSPKYADKDRMVFVVENKVIKYNEIIKNLLYKLEEDPKITDEFSIAMVNYWIKKIEKHLKDKGVYNINKKLSYLDISKTHEAFFIKCPNCGNEYESVSNNWALAKLEGVEELFLMCANCKGDPHYEYPRT